MSAPISDNQASQMGKSGAHGAQDENTHQQIELRQLVVFIRQKKPSAIFGDDLSGASSLVSKATGTMDRVTDAVEGAMAAIPGLNMLIKEEKDKSSDAEQEAKNKYIYFEDYSSWDKLKKDYDAELTEINSVSCTLEFEYEGNDAAARKQEAEKLASKVKSKLSEWAPYSRCVHFVGLAQGGNIANECTSILCDDSNFNSDDKCWVQTVITIATPQYKQLHQLNDKSLKGKGKAIHFGNRNDFSQQAIAFFEPSDKLIEKIKDANKGTLSVFTGKIKMHVIKALAIAMKGVGTGQQSPQQLFDGVKGEIEGLVTGVLNIIKQLVGEGVGLIKPGDVSYLKNIMNGYDQIPSQCISILGDFFKSLPDALANQAKKAVNINGGDDKASLGPQMLMGMFDCLCPLIDTISDSLAVFTYDAPASEEFSNQIIETYGVTKVYLPGNYTAKDLNVEPVSKAQSAANSETQLIDMAPVMMSKVRQLLMVATANKPETESVAVSEMNGKQKQALAEAIFIMATPMLSTKKDFYAKLLDIIPFSIDEYIMKADSDKAASQVTSLLSKLNLKLPAKLQVSLTRNKAEVARIAGFFKKNNYPVSKGENTLKYVYESHNKALEKCHGEVALALDKQTKMLDHMKAKGYRNTATADGNKYELETSSEKSDVMMAPEVS